MKKLYLIVLTVLTALTATAQTVGEAFYIYRNDGGFNAFFRDEVDSIAYSHYDLDSLYYDENVTQLVYTPDSLYRIPLAAIDSVSFVQPEEEYKSEVLRMNDSWLPYVIGISDYSITFRSDTPADFLPSVGQVVVAETFEPPFDTGFSGRVTGVDTNSDGIICTVEAVALSDIYEHLVTMGISASQTEDGNIPQTRRRLWGINTDRGLHFPLPNIDFAIGPVTLSCVPDVVLKYIVCVGEPNLKNYVDIKVHHTYQGSVKLDCKIDADYKPEPKWGKGFIPITTGVPGLYGKIMFGAYVRAAGAVQLSATQPFTINGVEGFVFSEDNGLRPVHDWKASMQDTEISLSLDGSVSAGLAVRLQFGIIHERIASADLTAYVGPKFSAHLGLSSAGLIDKTLYSAIKDSEITLSLGAEIVPGYRWVGDMEHRELPVSLELGYQLNHWYAVPEFDNLKWQADVNGGDLTSDIKRNLLPKVSLGWALYDVDDNLYKSEYFTETYRKAEDWPHQGMTYHFDNVKKNTMYKAYPIVKLFGMEMRANKYVDVCVMDCPVELSDFKVTKSQYQKGAFTHNGQSYDYCFNVSVTATLDDEATGISDWGYIYLDPNGQEAKISLRQFGTTYTDTRWAYYRNGTPPFTCTLYGYVQYVGSDELVYGEPHDYPLEYGETTCPDANHPHMIDLGLPSGTKWACCNVGASTPEGYGNYYAWGETSPKSVYTWDTYQYGSSWDNVVNIGSDIAGTQYDAATANWGAPWRMPSVTQIRELLERCTSTWTTQNGVNGRKFVGPNGGTIFLPAAGGRWDGELNGAGANGVYWSSTLSEGYPGSGYELYFGSGGAGWSGSGRHYGHSVRPVR